MGLFGLNLVGEGLKSGLDFVSGGATRLLGEDSLARIPLIGGLTGAQTDATKELLATQQRLAEETRKQQQRNQQMRMNALGQQMMAFNPQNQAMAQMFGPEAAFSPQQMAQMAADPGARTRAEYDAAHQKAFTNGAIDPNTRRRTGGSMEGWSADDYQRMLENERRMQMVQQNAAPLGPGPAPIRMPTPQNGRRY